jgi:hypothetical protein
MRKKRKDYESLWGLIEGYKWHDNEAWAMEMSQKSRILAWKAWLDGRAIAEEDRVLRDFQQYEG